MKDHSSAAADFPGAAAAVNANMKTARRYIVSGTPIPPSNFLDVR
jgi:hypothetical protein